MMVKFFVFSLGVALTISNSLFSYSEEDLESLQYQVKHGFHIQCAGFDLQGTDLRGLNLKDADFLRAKLRGANFSGANLRGAIFAEAELQKANFSRSNLSRASFYHANLNKANFKLANLTSADFTNASANGTKFKGAQLLNAKCENISSAKGSLLKDKRAFSRKLMKEKEVDTIKGKLSTQKSPDHIVFKAEDTFRDIHPLLYSLLSTMSSSYAMADFRQLFLSSETNAKDIIQDCLSSLKSPTFRPFVTEVMPIKDGKVLIVFLNTQKDAAIRPHFERRTETWKLDLHGKISLRKKKEKIDKFVEESYEHSRDTIEIITGRGLNNPDGVMGTLWHICENYLLNGKFKDNIQKIQSISKNGGWRVFLKPYKNNVVRKKVQPINKNRSSAKIQLTKYAIDYNYQSSKKLIPESQPKPSLSKKKKAAAQPKPSSSKKMKNPAPAKQALIPSVPAKKMTQIQVAAVKKVMTPKAEKAISPQQAPTAVKGSTPKNSPTKTNKKKKPATVKKGPTKPKG